MFVSDRNGHVHSGGGVDAPVPVPDGLATMPPGPALAALLAELPMQRVCGYDTVEILTAAYRQANHDRAVFLQAMLETGMRRAHTPDTVARLEHPGEFAAEEARAALVWSRRRSDTTFALAYDVHFRLPMLGEAMLAGELDEPRAAAFTHWTVGLSDDQAAQVCYDLLPAAASMLVGELIDALKRAAIAIDPEWAGRRYRQAVRGRRVQGSRNPDGSVNVSGLDLPVDRAAAACHRVDTLARRCKRAGDTRPSNHIRADLYLGMLDGTFQAMDDGDIVNHVLANPFVEPSASPATPRPDDDGGALDGGDAPSSQPGGGGGSSGGSSGGAGSPGGVGGAGSPGGVGGAGSPGGVGGAGSPGGVGGAGSPGGVGGAGSPGGVGGAGSPGGVGGAGSPGGVGSAGSPGGAGQRDVGGAGKGGVNSAYGDCAGRPDREYEASHSDPRPSDVERRASRQLDGGGPDTDSRHRGGPGDGGPGDGRPNDAGRWTPGELRVGLATLLGLDERPAELVGWDFIPAALARQIILTMTSAEFRWVLCDAEGHLVATGITSARPDGGAPAGGVSGSGRGVVELQLRGDEVSRVAAVAHSARPDYKDVVDDVIALITVSGVDVAPVPGLDGKSGVEKASESSASDHSRRRTPGARLRRLVQIRDRKCTHPACRAPARHADQDHVVDYAHGGLTTDANLACCCRHHHRLKHCGGWAVAKPGPLTTVWTSSLGRRHTNIAPPIMPMVSAPRPYAGYPADSIPSSLGCGCCGYCGCGPTLPSAGRSATSEGPRQPSHPSSQLEPDEAGHEEVPPF